MKNQYTKATIVESIHAIDYSRRLELFEAACKVFAIPMKKRVWSQIQFFAWLRAKFNSWLYVSSKNHMKKHRMEFRQFLAVVGPENF